MLKVAKTVGGIGFLELMAKGVGPGEVDDGGHGGFDVEPAVGLAVVGGAGGFEDDLAEEPDGWLVKQDGFGEVVEEGGLMAHQPVDMATELVD